MRTEWRLNNKTRRLNYQNQAYPHRICNIWVWITGNLSFHGQTNQLWVSFSDVIQIDFTGQDELGKSGWMVCNMFFWTRIWHILHRGGAIKQAQGMRKMLFGCLKTVKTWTHQKNHLQQQYVFPRFSKSTPVWGSILSFGVDIRISSRELQKQQAHWC